MPDLLINAKESFLLHRLTIFRFFLFSVGALCTSLQTALAGTDWATSDRQTQIMIVIGIVGSWVVTMSAFLDKSMARIAHGQNPFLDSQVTSSTEITERTKTTIETPPPAS